MKYFFEDCKKLKAVIENSKHILILFDYDGTLTPIVSTPEKAIMDGDVKRILNSLSKKNKFTIGIISGRKLSEIKRLVGLKRIFYCGNHGLEIEGPGIRFIHPAHINLRADLVKIKEALQKEIRQIKGAMVEDKGLGLSLHYRLVKEKYVPKIKEVFKHIASPYLKSEKINLSSGKKVLEIRPFTSWNKGKAVKFIEQFVEKRKDDLTIYLGDDITDEDAFHVLRNNGLTVFVGRPKDGQAKYFLNNTKEVKDFLERLLCLN